MNIDTTVPMRALRILGVPLVLALLVTGTNPRTALADCGQLSPWPSFTMSASSADRIIIGTVIRTPPGEVMAQFTLRVDEVLRGQAPATIRFDKFRSGAPQPICPEYSYLMVQSVGDRIALAYGAHLPGLDRPITAVAFVAPSVPAAGLMPEMERLTVGQVRAIAALPPTDAALATSEPVPASRLLGWALAVLAAIAFVRWRESGPMSATLVTRPTDEPAARR